MSTAIDVRGLRKRFGARTVLDDLEFSVGDGEIFALLGPNGAGKTTAINILTTLLRADGGTARVCGFEVSDEPVPVRQRIGLTGQSAAVDEALSATENLVMFGSPAWIVARPGGVRPISPRSSTWPSRHRGRCAPSRRHAPAARPGAELRGHARGAVPR